jgi:hypothetical protein
MLLRPLVLGRSAYHAETVIPVERAGADCVSSDENHAIEYHLSHPCNFGLHIIDAPVWWAVMKILSAFCTDQFACIVSIFSHNANRASSRSYGHERNVEFRQRRRRVLRNRE